MSENLISWNFTNWITVVLMVLGGYIVIGMVAKLVSRSTGGANEGA